MKALLFVICLLTVSSSFANEVETQCSAMNGSREKIVKAEKPKTQTRTSTSRQ